MDETDSNRAKVLGQLILKARESSGCTIEECAELLGISPEAYAAIEETGADISLPELEALALFFSVPMAYFWGSESLEEEKSTDFELYVSLRQRILGSLLRQARLDADLSIEQLAEQVDLDAQLISSYEAGEQSIPYFVLENLANSLNLDIQYFAAEGHGPLAKLESERQMLKRFNELPSDVQAFVVEPINLSYLETAMRLSKMDADKLRDIAEGLLDITF
jgi:transcriptional regulator with XRE-family HTH domain